MARKGISPLVIALIIIGILAASIFIYFQIVRGMSPPEAPAPLISEAPTAPPPPAEAAEPELEVPPLDSSDEAVRSWVGTLSAHPQLASWLVPEDLVRRFVATVVNVADNESPRPHLGFLEPRGAFQVREQDGQLITDAKSFARYNLIAEIFTSIDTADGARLYRSLEPLFDEAYQELGYPDGDFDVPLARAIDRVVSTRIPSGHMAIKRRVTNYRFSDPKLEELSAVEKHLLRMGPSNARQIQRKLQVMRTALSLDD